MFLDMVTTISKAGVTAFALLVSPKAVGFVVAQSVTPTTVLDQDLAHWAIEKGGAFAVILIILFFYRRDYVQLTNFWKEQAATLKELVEENTKAQTETSAALRENTVVVHQAKNVMARYLPSAGSGYDRT